MTKFRGKLTVLIAVATALIVGCATTEGRKVEQGAVAQIKEGSSTRADVQRILGAPYSTSKLQDGTERMQWLYVKATSSAGYGLLAYMGAGTSTREVVRLNVTLRDDIVTACVFSTQYTEGKGGVAAYGAGGGNSTTTKCSDVRP
jgi:outer membrane protein assembly factor BamE (lipoprotein component of BamABCDE complex)